MASTIPLMVAIYDNPGIKHWSLFINAKDKVARTIIHVLGARQRYFRDVRTPSDARISNSLVELCVICEIEETKIDAVKNIAWDTPLHNEEPDYSCQDFILDVLERLEEGGVIDAASDDYKKNMDNIKAKRESWQ